MAGVKGRSGGKRPNTGGARPNSGPKKKPPPVLSIDPPAPVVDKLPPLPVVPAPIVVTPETLAGTAPVKRTTPPRSDADKAIDDQVAAHLSNTAGPVPPPGADPDAADMAVDTPAIQKMAPLDFLKAIYRERNVPIKERIRAAIAAAQYEHLKKGDGGIKAGKGEKAKAAAAGKFGASAAPLRAVK